MPLRPAPREQHVAGPAGDLAVWDYPGDPPDTLLLHGVGGMGRMWDFFAQGVDGRLRMLAPDARGHGDSAKPPYFVGNQHQRQRMAMAEVKHTCMRVQGNTMNIEQAIGFFSRERIQADAAHGVAPQRMGCPARVRHLAASQHNGDLRRQCRQQRVAHPTAHRFQVFKRIDYQHAAIPRKTGYQLPERSCGLA